MDDLDMDSQADNYWRMPPTPPVASTLSGVNGALSGMPRDYRPFDPMEHTRLAPSSFDVSTFEPMFVTPKIISSNPHGMLAGFGFGDVAMVEPSQMHLSGDFAPSASTASTSTSYFPYAPEQPFNPSASSATLSSLYPSTTSAFAPPPQQPQQASATTSQQYVANGPIYTPYGSSVITLPTDTSYKLPAATTLPPPPFSPGSQGLPLPPPPGTSTNFAGLYSTSGFDMISVLAKVANRPNPTLQIGPVDTSCSFLVVDAKKFDYPIVFCSDTFTKLTGYTSEEIMGRNCRFLQSPDGLTTAGQPRKYTDSHAAWHMRQHIVAGKESQSSLINYRKGGKTFINLVTIIPITWDDDSEIAYYVGFQVDLVDQPNAILDRMRDGTYVVNYSLLAAQGPANPMAPAGVMKQAKIAPVNGGTPMTATMGSIDFGAGGDGGREELMLAAIEGEVKEEEKEKEEKEEKEEDKGLDPKEVLKIVEKKGYKALKEGQEKAAWNKFMLDQSTDFVHVLSLKGSILYSSPSALKMLEYTPSEIVGRTIQSICHPSDVVPVMRVLKDAGSITHPRVSLLYRLQRKHSGYIWLEAEGKLHVEPGKGRKSIILIGRPRETLSMKWSELRGDGGLGEREFWCKMSEGGMVLSTTSAVQGVLAYSQQEMVGTSIFQLVHQDDAAEVRGALRAALNGTSTSCSYRLKGRLAFQDVVTCFYAHEEVPGFELDPGAVAGTVIAQTSLASSHSRKRQRSVAFEAPEYHNIESAIPESTTTVDGTPAQFQSTFKTLSHPSAANDNVFDELNTTRCTSWQYELHQLQILNKKLRDEKEHLMAIHGTQSSLVDPAENLTRSGSGSSSASTPNSRASSASLKRTSCEHCGRSESPEWRTGPSGLKSLCNACGLRYAKSAKPNPSPSTSTLNLNISRRTSISPSLSNTDTVNSPTVFSPYQIASGSGSLGTPSSVEDSISPRGW